MKEIWNLISTMQVRKRVKNLLFLTSTVWISALLGGVVWLIIGRSFFPGITWLICCMGYPGLFLGLFGGILYLYNHEFT